MPSDGLAFSLKDIFADSLATERAKASVAATAFLAIAKAFTGGPDLLSCCDSCLSAKPAGAPGGGGNEGLAGPEGPPGLGPGPEAISGGGGGLAASGIPSAGLISPVAEMVAPPKSSLTSAFALVVSCTGAPGGGGGGDPGGGASALGASFLDASTEANFV